MQHAPNVKMDHSDENKLILQLINYKTDEKQSKTPEYPFHDDKTISQISKSISEIIYDPKTKKQQRQSVIGLINKWTNNSHLINNNNQEIFINAVLKTNKLNINTFPENCTKPKNTVEILTKKYKNNLQTKIKSGLIDMYHKKVFENTFDINIPVKSLQSANAESVIDFLQNFEDIHEEIAEKSVVDVDFTIKMILALLHSGVINEGNEEVMIKLIRDLGKAVNVGFIRYIWKNKFKLTPGICRIILEDYQFLYETVVLKYFSLVLTEGTQHVLQDFNNSELCDISDLSIMHDLNEILLCCFKYVCLTEKILHLLDMVLVLSHFDLRVLKAINQIKNKYLS